MRTTILIRRIIFILLAGVFSIGNYTTSWAQGCKQVEIEYDVPDCYKPKGGPGAISGNRDCVPVTVCEKQLYSYSASGGPWATYSWVITSGPASPAINPSATAANVNITWPLQGTYILTLTVTDGAGNSFTQCIEVTVKE